MKEIRISSGAIATIFRWAQSNREIGFMCAGRKKVITHVFRIKNIDKESRVAFVPDRGQQRAIRNALKTRKMALLCEGHSHPHVKDTAKPSRGDCEFIKPNALEIIVCPAKNEIRCWRMSRCRAKTLKQEVPIKVIGRYKSKK